MELYQAIDNEDLSKVKSLLQLSNEKEEQKEVQKEEKGKETKDLQSLDINYIHYEFDMDHRVFQEVATPFILACNRSLLPVVDLLLKHKDIQVNKTTRRNETAFWTACSFGHVEVVKLLLKDPRVDVSKGNNSNITPFHIACYRGHKELVQLLLGMEYKDRMMLDQVLSSYFFLTCQMGNCEIVKLLMKDPRVDVNEISISGETAFGFACSALKLDVVEILLKEDRLNLNKEGNGYDPLTPLISIDVYTQIQSHKLMTIIQLLIDDLRVDPRVKQKAYELAKLKGKKSIVTLFEGLFVDNLLNQRKRVNTLNNGELSRLLLIACSHGWIEDVKLITSLLKKKRNV
jgi:ankyrin repeat protein